MTCASSGAAAAVKMLLARGAAVNAAEPSQHQTALMWAAAERHADVVGAAGRGGRRPAGPHEEGLHRAPLRGARGRHRERHAAARRGRRREHPIAARLARAAGAARPTNRRSPRAARRCSSRRSGARCRWRCYLLEHGADPNAGDAGFTPLHWAAGTWEGGVSNPVYGFSDPMSGIPNRQAKLQLVQALLARGANPNGRMTKRPPTSSAATTTPPAPRRSCWPAPRPTSR